MVYKSRTDYRVVNSPTQLKIAKEEGYGEFEEKVLGIKKDGNGKHNNKNSP